MKKSTTILLLIFTSLLSAESFSTQKKDLNIALVYPEITKSVLFKYDKSFNPTESWELFFMRNQYAYEMVNDDEMSSIGDDVDVVVIPSMTVINEEIVADLKDLLEEGKGILITGDFAEYNDEGIRISDDYRRDILGFRIARLDDSGKLSVNHSLSGDTPLSIGLKPGQKILLQGKPVLYYSYDLSPDCTKPGNYIRGNGEFSGLVMNIVKGKRILWYGFNIDQIIGGTDSRFLYNSFNWLSSVPRAFISCWPDGFTSAAIIYENINHASDFYNNRSSFSRSLKLNYFISPGIIENSPYILNEIKNPGNINLLWDDFFFSGLSDNKRTDWLNSTEPLIKTVTDQKYSGIYSYGGFYDSDISELLSKTGYSFILSSGYSDSYFYNYDTTNHIYKFYISNSPGPDFIPRVEFILNQGGIGYVNIDSLGDKGLNFLGSRKCWVTTFSELLEWVKSRDKIEVTINTYNKDNYDINIRNRGSAPVANTVIWISIPGRKGKAILENSSYQSTLSFDYEKNMYSLKISSIEEYQTIFLKVITQNQ
jgi:hypothetical protein